MLAGYDKLINSTISGFIATNVSDQLVLWPAPVSDSSDPVRVILPFKVIPLKLFYWGLVYASAGS